jgi:hypothetical protein
VKALHYVCVLPVHWDRSLFRDLQAMKGIGISFRGRLENRDRARIDHRGCLKKRSCDRDSQGLSVFVSTCSCL